MTTGGVHAAIAAVRSAVADLLACDRSSLSDGALLDAVRELHPVVCQLRAAETLLIGAVHTRGAAGVDGSVSTVDWLRNGLRMGDAPQQVRSAGALARMPAIAAAYVDGLISAEHVAAIARVAPDLSDEQLAGGAEAELLEQARVLAPGRFVAAAIRIRDRCDPEAAERRRCSRLEQRWLFASRTFEGAVALNGMLDPESGELLLATLAAFLQPPSTDDSRSAATRRADALIDLCRIAANHAPDAGGEKPHITVTIDLNTLRSQLTPGTDDQVAGGGGEVGDVVDDGGDLASNTGTSDTGTSGDVGGVGNGADEGANGRPTTCGPTSGDPPPDSGPSGSRPGGGGASSGAVGGRFGADAWGVGVLGSGWSIGPQTARRLACDAGIVPLLLASPSEPLDIGRLSRTVPSALRRALVFRDGGCRFPLCDRPAAWTDAHHIRHWADGGATALTNLILLCCRHHTLVHEHGWHINLEPAIGTVRVRHPAGRQHESISHPRAFLPLRGRPPGPERGNGHLSR